MKLLHENVSVSLKFVGIITILFSTFVAAIYFATHNNGWATFWCAAFFGMALGFIANRYSNKE